MNLTRLTGALLAVAIIALGFASAGVAARDNHCGENLVWSLDHEGLLTISGTGEMDSFIEDKPPWGKLNIRKVIIEPGVTSIGALAFEACLRLKSVEIPDTVTAIGDYAFERCNALKSISLPDNIRELGANPFSACRSLKEISLPPDHPVFIFRDGLLISKPDRRLICRAGGYETAECVVPEGIEAVGDYAFSGCVSLEAVIIPEGVTSLGRRAFFDCGHLMSADLPASLETIGSGAFSGCEWLKHVTLREGLRSIGTAAFYCCRRLEEISLPDSLEEMGNRPFDICQFLSRISVSEDHPCFAFENGLLYSKTDWKLIYYAAQNPFVTCIIPQGIKIIGERAFGNGRDLRKIVLPDSVREIEKQGFDGAWNVEEFVFSSGLETIGRRAFEGMSRLETITLPEGVKSIGDEAFCDCTALQTIKIPASVETFGKDVFGGTDTLNLSAFVSEDSAAEAYCRENGLRTVRQGQPIPEPEVDLVEAFAMRYPGYNGLYQIGAETENWRVYLVRRPDEALVLLCGVKDEDKDWSIIESAPLPEGSKVILYDGLELINLGYARCAVCRYYDDVWGIDYVGWKDTEFGPRWVGSWGPPTRHFGNHPWSDLRTIDWSSLSESREALLDAMDWSDFAMPNQKDPDGRTPIYTLPDSAGKEIALLRNGAPLFVLEKNGEWTHVYLGRDDGKTWKMEGWIRTEDLVFGKEADTTILTDPDYDFFANQIGTLTIITPVSSEEIPNSDYDSIIWCVIGEEIIDGQEYWLVYDCYTEQLGFILKSSMNSPRG